MLQSQRKTKMRKCLLYIVNFQYICYILLLPMRRGSDGIICLRFYYSYFISWLGKNDRMPLAATGLKTIFLAYAKAEWSAINVYNHAKLQVVLYSSIFSPSRFVFSYTSRREILNLCRLLHFMSNFTGFSHVVHHNSLKQLCLFWDHVALCPLL